jgi:lipid-A-disaccharide synthase
LVRIMVVAGEVSGDMHAARVVREIKRIAPDTEFYGMGSTFLAEEGVRILIDPTSISTIGFLEAFRDIRIHLKHLKILKESIYKERPDAIFLVDYSGFNMLMARLASKENIPTINYFSPSAWVWGRWRARWMVRYNVIVAAVFPMEARVYREMGAEVEFVGHPLVDLVKNEKKRPEIFQKPGLDPERPIIGLLPGSRRQEIERLLPEMLEAAVRLQTDDQDYQFVLPLAAGIDRERVADVAANYDLVLKLVEKSTYEVMGIARLLIVASGTATLEAAIIGTPMIIIYQTSWSTYQLGRLLVNLKYIGLPNIIANGGIVPELLQEKATADNIYLEARKLLTDQALLDQMRSELKMVKESLGRPGAVKRTAELVLRGISRE